MKSCRNANPSRRPSGTNGSRASGQSIQDQPAAVNRYCHPIRTKGSSRSNTTEELLSYILETLSHQADLLEELLRRTEEKDTV